VSGYVTPEVLYVVQFEDNGEPATLTSCRYREHAESIGDETGKPYRIVEFHLGMVSKESQGTTP
jgi:hypothetical protein